MVSSQGASRLLLPLGLASLAAAAILWFAKPDFASSDFLQGVFIGMAVALLPGSMFTGRERRKE